MSDNEFYKGNQEVKKKGVVHHYTEEQIKEIIKCNNDIEYFLSNYVYIISLDEGKVLFKPYEFQKEMLKAFHEHRMVCCTLSRQSGKCLEKQSSIKLRNKKTGEIFEQAIGEFFNARKNK